MTRKIMRARKDLMLSLPPKDGIELLGVEKGSEIHIKCD